MNGFAERGLDEDAFGEKKDALSGIRSFDAFRKCLSSQTRRMSSVTLNLRRCLPSSTLVALQMPLFVFVIISTCATHVS